MQGNVDESGPIGASLAEMFQQGQQDIPFSRSADLFGQLEGRQLSDAEAGIIARRVALQRSLLAEYECRERGRKAQVVSKVFPQLPTLAVEQVLASHCSEDDAIEALLADPDLLARLQGAGAPAAAQPAAEPEQLLPVPPQAKRRRSARAWALQQSGVDACFAQAAAAGQAAASPSSSPGSSGPATLEPPGNAGASAPARPARRAARGVSQLVQAMQTGPSQPAHGRPPSQRAAVKAQRPQQRASPAPDSGSPGPNAPSRKPRLGRVKKCSTKAVQLLAAGRLRVQPGWHNGGYIFPSGFRSATSFRSSVRLDASCQHVCSILGRGGAFWPAPTFQIVADDRPGEPIAAKSATGAWSAVLARIRSVIQQRREAGEDLPPPPGTAIPGPEFFGLTSESIVSAIEQLDPRHECAAYWQGKQERAAFIQAHGTTPQKRRPSGAAKPAGKRGSREPSASVSISSCSERGAAPGSCGEDSETEAVSSRWAGLERAERLAKRHGEPSAQAGAGGEEQLLLPGVLDPITLQQVRAPAMSPAGHVMGAASWAAVLAERGRCPFTQQPLRRQQLVLLTSANIERLRSRLILR